MKFRIGLSLANFEKISFSPLLQLINFLKFEHLEFVNTNFEKLTTHIDKFKGKHIAFHSPYKNDYLYDLTTPYSESPKIDTYINNVNKFALQKKIKVNGVIVHPPIDSKGDQELFFTRLEKLKPLPLLENIFHRYGKINSNWSTFSEWFQTVESSVNRQIGFCFDFPHAFINEGKEGFLSPPKHLMEHFRSDEGYAHISGSQRDLDTHLPLTVSEMPIQPIFDFLKREEFCGTLNMELSPIRCNSLQDFVQGVFDSYMMLWNLKRGLGYWQRKLLLGVSRKTLVKKITKEIPSLKDLKTMTPFHLE